MLQVKFFLHYDHAKQHWTSINYDWNFEFQSFPTAVICGLERHGDAGKLLPVSHQR